ncbi:MULTISPECIES: hypothetical protein [unclassified Paenibacillus]|uniref:hypothetical protein n=1 Tax=unclassified Paenibacillus TaxID=185978 RepID=UPI0002D2F838|nr:MULTISPECIES: hypothetical protein [unclassified Paenibacillus]ETT30679.1 hypothetical protein C161_27283 [Paenibacillus sp. FSL R5-192]
MGVIAYILIGAFDVFAVLALMLRLYRLPVRDRFWEKIIFSVLAAVASYFIRIVIGIPMIDTAVLMLLVILFMRYVLEIKLFYAALMSSAGMSAYVAIQLALAMGYMAIGGNAQAVIVETHGYKVQLLQITAICIAYIVSSIMTLFRWGFSFVPLPPHDFNIELDYSKNKGLLITTIGVLIFISFAMVLLLNYMIVLLVPAALLSFGISYYFSNRRDLQID